MMYRLKGRVVVTFDELVWATDSSDAQEAVIEEFRAQFGRDCESVEFSLIRPTKRQIGEVGEGEK